MSTPLYLLPYDVYSYKEYKKTDSLLNFKYASKPGITFYKIICKTFFCQNVSAIWLGLFEKYLLQDFI